MSSQTSAKLKLFAAMLLFASAIGSLWFGISEGPNVLQIKLTYIVAIVLALFGFIVIKWPTMKKN